MSSQDPYPRGTATNPVVIIPVRTYQPWPEAETLEIAGVTIERALGNDTYLVQAVIESDADDTNENLHRRARASLEAAVDLLRRAMPAYPMAPHDSYQIERGPKVPSVGTASLGASATLIQPTVLSANELGPARAVALAYQQATGARKRRLRAAAYWLEQVEIAPDMAVRAAAAFFAIEAAIDSAGKFVTKKYVDALGEMGFAFDASATALVTKSIEDLQQTRANLVHYGNLESPNLEAHFRLVRDLAKGIVGFKMGLPVPANLEILNGISGVTRPNP